MDIESVGGKGGRYIELCILEQGDSDTGNTASNQNNKGIFINLWRTWSFLLLHQL